VAGTINRWLDALDHGYARVLQWTLGHRLVTVLTIVALFAGSLLLRKKIGSEFFPETDEGQFSVIYKAPIGTRVEKTELITEQVEKITSDTLASLRDPKVDAPIYTTILANTGLGGGRTSLFSSNTGSHAGNVQVNLVSRNDRIVSDVEATEKVRAALRDALPGVQVFFFTGGIVKRFLNMGSAAPIDIEVLGYDVEAGSRYARDLKAKLNALADAKGQPLLTDVQIQREENAPQLDVVVDRQKAGVLGISEQDVAQTVLTSLLGNTQLSPIPFTDQKTGNEYFINVRMADRYRTHTANLRELFVRTPRGDIVTVDTIAKVERSSGPVVIDRKYMQRVVHVTANVAPDKDLGAAGLATQDALTQLQLPEGFTVQLGGQAAEQEKAFRGLIFAALMALALVYMVLASQFKSLVDPLVIMFSVPLGISGVFLMLFLTGTKLSVNSFMGIIMMVGIVVSNGVLLVDFANVLRRRGKPIIEATIEAGRTRLRPILMTTIATVFGLVPMALGIGEGSETNLPLARAVIGGLTVSTIFTLFLVPALYTVFDRFAKRKTPYDDDDDDEPESDAIGGAAHA
jgi:multidrug efflux pump subunit AcrB